MLRALDGAAAIRWAELSVAALAHDRDALDRINVYPVADGDTGTNLLQTMRSAVSGLDPTTHTSLRQVLGTLARGALRGARGNSGMLLSQVVRGLAEEPEEAPDMDGESFRRALRRAHERARQAVAEPADGTLLSVLHAAAYVDSRAAELSIAVREATTASIRALEATTRQLPALTAAGVVDAGGRGLVVLLDVLHAVVNDGDRLAPETPEAAGSEASRHGSRYCYEVMYLLAESTEEAVSGLRDRLVSLGDCVSVVGDGESSWAVHVHCDDIGAAIESGIGTGRVSHIRVTRFADQASPGARPERAVLACTRGPEVTELFRSEGATVLRLDPERPAGVDDLVAAIDDTGARHVLVLPNDGTLTPIAEEAAGRATGEDREVVVVPTASPVQGLAALAVHDPRRRTTEDTVALAEAAAATRRGELLVARRRALTWVGYCEPGDVLGLADGEVVLIGGDLVDSARDLADRMLTTGGELVTALIDENAPDGLAEELEQHLRRTHPEVELSCYRAGDLAEVLLLGVE
ncbi:hypothetical protein FHX42_000544 [Saccharopolyspora lacisalsi]|uniref:DhaL domain-containing protein n=1 Tax=Halosaccharopolyspora lacisalsi TaxID=1000566 RepID=A0A839DVA0_9PSEU|nr:DAK2 domain-containing protein [Halosaccharopolyspora lacisalsi]MBA8823215.1 hypothetical protein [Halosaccharopolyspora lacisalsi]